MESVQVDVRLFGAFRKYAPDAVSLEVPRGTTVAALRQRLAAALRREWPTFHEQGLLDVSVFADDERILADDEQVGVDARRVALAILPPVCGG
jgi:molybdopterin converting factor small subunit